MCVDGGSYEPGSLRIEANIMERRGSLGEEETAGSGNFSIGREQCADIEGYA